jgi:hypothetical protein
MIIWFFIAVRKLGLFCCSSWLWSELRCRTSAAVIIIMAVGEQLRMARPGAKHDMQPMQQLLTPPCPLDPVVCAEAGSTAPTIEGHRQGRWAVV